MIQLFKKIPYSVLGIILCISTFLLIQVRCTAKIPQISHHALNSVIQAKHTSNNQWFNAKNNQVLDLKNKVVLIDFWTYSCINCIRTLNYMQKLHEKYADQGLVLMGVHSPEFEFEKIPKNVLQAITQYKITYPVIMDNEMAIWKSFDNHYWPAHYLFNRSGELIDTHFGEGSYLETENKIRSALGLAVIEEVRENTTSQSAWNNHQSPETYMGLKRQENLASLETPLVNKKIIFTSPKTSELQLNQWALRGDWTNGAEFIRSESANSELDFHFNSKNVYLVLGENTEAKQVKQEIPTVDVYLNDVKVKTLSINNHKLYTLIEQPKVTQGILTLRFNQPNIYAYAFTFGE